MNKETVDYIQHYPEMKPESLKGIENVESLTGNEKVMQFANMVRQGQDEDGRQSPNPNSNPSSKKASFAGVDKPKVLSGQSESDMAFFNSMKGASSTDRNLNNELDKS